MNRLLLVCRTAEARKAVEVCGMAGCSMLSAMPLDQFLFSIPEFFSIPAQGLPRTGRHRSPDRWVSFIAMGGHASGRRCRGREVNPFQRNGDRPSGISCSRRGVRRGSPSFCSDQPPEAVCRCRSGTRSGPLTRPDFCLITSIFLTLLTLVLAPSFYAAKLLHPFGTTRPGQVSPENLPPAESIFRLSLVSMCRPGALFGQCKRKCFYTNTKFNI